MKIDSHQHFIKYNAIEYDWIDNSLAKLRRDFLPADLKAEIDAAGIDGVVSVAARQIVEETSALLTYAKANPFILGVVGWVPLVSPGVVADLERFAADAKLCGVRHVLHDEPDPFYMLRDDFNEGIRRLKPFDLTYDILIFERHLPQTIRFVDRHPEQVFVLNHIAKPRIKEGLLEPWATKIRELAKRGNVFCKLSGMVTEADWSEWTEAQLRPYAEIIIEAFGPARTMFGSDWPVCLVATQYARWVKVVQKFISTLSETEQALVFGSTSVIAYGLQIPQQSMPFKASGLKWR